MSNEMLGRVAEVLADRRCRDVHGAGWPGGELEDMLGPARVPLPCESCRGWARYVADALLPLLAEAEARGVERGRAEVRERVEAACEEIRYEQAGPFVSDPHWNAYENSLDHITAALTEEQP